jgi:hypothetical protein
MHRGCLLSNSPKTIGTVKPKQIDPAFCSNQKVALRIRERPQLGMT